MGLHLAYIIYQNIQTHLENRTPAYAYVMSLDKNSNTRVLYRLYTEQFELHFTDIHKS